MSLALQVYDLVVALRRKVARLVDRVEALGETNRAFEVQLKQIRRLARSSK